MNILSLLNPDEANGLIQELIRSNQADQQMLKQDTMINTLSEIRSKIDSLGNGLSTTFDYINHPDKLLKVIWEFTVTNSFWICIGICMGGMIFYICGAKKGLKYSKLSFMSYFLIQAINAAVGL